MKPDKRRIRIVLISVAAVLLIVMAVLSAKYAKRAYRKIRFLIAENRIERLEKTIDYPTLPKEEDEEAKPLPASCYVSKKGLQVDEHMVEDAIDLGMEWGFITFFFNDLITVEPTKYEYTYNGRTYYFDERYVETFDYMISRLTGAGVKVMASVVARYNEDLPELRYPGIGLNPGTNYYAFNVKTPEGIDMIEAAMSFLLERYNGGDHGYVNDWVIGNEVNDNLQYNYIGPCDGETYVAEYYEQFKVFYNVIRRYDEECNVYIPLVHRWNTANTMTDYGGKFFLEYFHECEEKDLEMDWGLAIHPYPYPLGDPDTLDDGDEATTDTDGQPTYGGEVTMEYTSPLVSMKNIHVVTDYLSHNLLKKDGSVRSIVCSEVGYTSYSVLCGENQSKQAANIAYAQTRAQMDPHIDAFIIRCQLDIYEGSPYFQFGLRDDAEDKYFNKKLAYDVFRYMDTTEAEEYIDDCLPVLGLKNWSDVIKRYDPDVYKGMTEYTEGEIYRTVSEKAGTDSTVDQVSVIGAYEDANYDDWMYRCYFMDETGDGAADPTDLCGYGAVGFEIKRRSGEANGELKARIRMRSGNHILEAEGVLIPGDSEKLILPISGWEYIESVDNIELWLNDAATELKYSAEYNVTGLLLKTDDIQQKDDYENITLRKPEKKSLESLIYSEIPDLPYTGYHQRPEVIVSDGEKVLTDGTDYCISYANDKEAGTAYAVIQGLGAYEGTHVIEYRIDCEYGDIFDPVYYLEHNRDVGSVYGNDAIAALKHFLIKGMKEGRQGCRDFNPMMYMENYPDLRAVYGNDPVKYYLHYKNVGKSEGRIAYKLLNSAQYLGVDYTEVYDAAYYARNNPQLFIDIDRDEWKLIRHFVETGMNEGKRGSAEFDVMQYKDAHPELVSQYGDDLKAYYIYYIEEGFTAGDSGTPYEEPVWIADEPFTYRGKDITYIYDPEYYSTHYDDAAALAGDPEALIRHFVVYGMKEGRRGNKEFDPRIYMGRYIDVRNAYNNLVEMTYDDYLNYGREAGR